MAKQMSFDEQIEALKALGIELTPEQLEKADQIRAEKFVTAAIEKVSKVSDLVPENVEAFVSDLFEVSTALYETVNGEARKVQAGAIRTVREIEIETVHGMFKVSLRSAEVLED